MSRRWQHIRECYPHMELVLAVLFILCVGHVCSQERRRKQENPCGSLGTDPAPVWTPGTDAGAAVSRKTGEGEVRSPEIVTRHPEEGEVWSAEILTHYEWNNGTDAGVAWSPGTEAGETGNSGNEAGEVVHSVNDAGKVVHSVNEEREVVHSVIEAEEVVHSVNETGEVEHAVNEAGEVVNSVNEAGEVVNSVNEAGDRLHSVNEAGEVVHSVNEAGEVIHSVNEAGEVVHSVNEEREVVHSVNKTEEVVHSVNEEREVVHSVNEEGKVEHSVNKTEEVVHFVNKAGKVVQSVNEEGEVEHSVNEAGEVVHSVNEAGEVIYSVNEAGEVEHSVNEAGEVIYSVNEAGEVVHSVNEAGEVVYSVNEEREVVHSMNEAGDTGSPGSEAGETGNFGTMTGETWSQRTKAGEAGNSLTGAGEPGKVGFAVGETESPWTWAGETVSPGTKARETGNSGTASGVTGNSGAVSGETGNSWTKTRETEKSETKAGKTGSPRTEAGESGSPGTKAGESGSPRTEAGDMWGDGTTAEAPWPTDCSERDTEVNLSSKVGGDDEPDAEIVIPEGLFPSVEEWNLQNLSSRVNDTDCMCVPLYQCASNGFIKTDGADIMDIRNRFGSEPVYNVETCPNDDDSTQMTCCKLPPGALPIPLRSDSTPLQPPPTDATAAAAAAAYPKPCGTRNGYEVADEWLRVSAGEDTSFGEFPWMLALLESSGDPDSIDTFKCGASLIHPQVALTTAHCVRNRSLTYKIRAGDYDTSGLVEGLPHQDREVAELLIPDNYNSRTLANNVALLILDRPVTPADNVGTICLPEKDENFDNKPCVATGWGRTIANGSKDGFFTLLKKVDLTATPSGICQKELRTTRLGKFFILDPSFICARGLRNQDTCSGDGGGPLACPNRHDQTRYSLAGAVSWGIGCGSKTPGVYAHIAHNRYWIGDHLSSRGFAANEPL